jgi:hypothetical protein
MATSKTSRDVKCIKLRLSLSEFEYSKDEDVLTVFVPCEHFSLTCETMEEIQEKLSNRFDDFTVDTIIHKFFESVEKASIDQFFRDRRVR